MAHTKGCSKPEDVSVRRVSDYLSSHIDLNDYTRKDIGCTQRDDGPKEVRNHHVPLKPRSTQSTGLFKRAVYSREFQTLRDTFYKRVFRGEGATANFRAILN